MASDKDRKKLALQKQREASEPLRKIGVDLRDALQQVAITLPGLGLSHLSLFAVKAINEASQNLLGVDLVVFLESNDQRPWAPLLCATMEWRDLPLWKGPVIATTLEACRAALESRAPRVLYYVFDLSVEDDARAVMADPRVMLATRSPDYANVIWHEYAKSATVCEDFDLITLLSVLLGKKDAPNA